MPKDAPRSAIGSCARAAVEKTRNGHIGVIGTRATIASGAYERALRSLNSEIRVTARACPLLVPLIEEGWLENPITDKIILQYLAPLMNDGVDTLVLGCTHYPLLRNAIARVVGEKIALVDSAQNCALAVRDLLQRENLCAPATDGGRGLSPDRLARAIRYIDEALGQSLHVDDLAKHVHMPVQSGSDRMLKRMIRRYTRAEYTQRVERLKKSRAGLTLSTDVIVGFCGETDDDFEATLSLVREIGFTSLFGFKYSPRPHTPALRLADDVPEAKKSERLARLFETSEALTRAP